MLCINHLIDYFTGNWAPSSRWYIWTKVHMYKYAYFLMVKWIYVNIKATRVFSLDWEGKPINLEQSLWILYYRIHEHITIDVKKNVRNYLSQVHGYERPTRWCNCHKEDSRMHKFHVTYFFVNFNGIHSQLIKLTQLSLVYAALVL